MRINEKPSDLIVEIKDSMNYGISADGITAFHRSNFNEINIFISAALCSFNINHIFVLVNRIQKKTVKINATNIVDSMSVCEIYALAFYEP